MSSKHNNSNCAQQSRRAVLRLGAGGMLAVGLAACGGGGGGDSSDEDLLAAYQKITGEMTQSDVIRIVGRDPQEISSSLTMYWSANGQVLWVRIFEQTGTVFYKRWDRVSPSETLRVDYI